MNIIMSYAMLRKPTKGNPPHSYEQHYRRNLYFHHLNYCREIFPKLRNFIESNTVKSHLSLQPPYIKISNKYMELQRNSTR